MRVAVNVARVALMGVLVVGVAAAASDEKFGKGVSLTEATSIKALYETPEKFVGKSIRVDGVVTAVCEEMGCWMALGETAKSENTVRMQTDHADGIVFPLSAKGKPASAEGVFAKIGDDGADFGKKYQLKATGAVIRQ